MPDHRLAATDKPDLLDRFLAPADVCVVGAVVGASNVDLSVDYILLLTSLRYLRLARKYSILNFIR